MRSSLAGAVAFGMVVGAGIAHAADVSVVGKKLVIVDKVTLASKAKAVFVCKDPGVTKGTGTDPAQISAELDVSYDSASGSFLAPQGSNWIINKSTVAKYVNKPAPTGGATKVAAIKPGKLLKLVAKSLGDTPIDISAAPSGDVLAVFTVTNGAETDRHCTAFQNCTHRAIAAGTGWKLVCKVAGPAACPVVTTTSTSTTSSTSSSLVTTTTMSSTTSSSSSTTTSSSSTTSTSTSSTTSTTEPPITGPSFPPDGGTVDYAFSGAPSPADAGGATVEFTNFTPDTTWSQLYWGPSSAALPTAGLDGSPHALTFDSISGTVATWVGTTDWTDPFDSTVYSGVPIEMRITCTGLGATPWVTSTSISGLDPGPGTGIGAVVDDSASFLDFSATVEFLADIPTDGSGNFIALNDVSNAGGQTNSSYTGAFYSQVP
jgi:hypothetical protein